MHVKKISLGPLVLIAYLGTAPVYWFPGVPVSVSFSLKYFMFSISVFLVFLLKPSGSTRNPSGVFGVYGFCILVLSMIFALMQSSVESVIKYVLDVLTCFIMLRVYQIVAQQGYNVYRIFFHSTVLLSLFCIVVIFSGILPGLRWPFPFLDGGLTVADVGFGGARTGWSLGIALYLPFGLMAATLMWEKRPVKSVLLALFFLLAIVGSQLTVGGRVGMTGSATIVILWILFRDNRNYLIILLVVSLIFLYLFIGSEFWADKFRMGKSYTAGGVVDFDEFSSGRMVQYDYAVYLIKNNPIFGYGFDYYGTERELYASGIHNVWLKLLVQGGVFSVGILAFCVYSVLYSFRLGRRIHFSPIDKLFYQSACSTLLAGVVMAMFEPSVIVGTFQTSAIWWASLGVVSGLSTRRRLRAMRPVGRRRIVTRLSGEAT